MHRVHLFAGSKAAQIDDALAHRGVDRVEVQELVRKTYSPIEVLGAGCPLHALQQNCLLAGEALKRLLDEPPHVLKPVRGTIVSDELEERGEVLRVGLATSLEIVEDRRALLTFGFAVRPGELGQMSVDHPNRQLRL